MSDQRPPRWKKIGVMLVVEGLVLGLLAYLVARAVLPRRPMKMESDEIFQSHPVLGTALRPNLSARIVIVPGRPHPVPFRPEKDYTSRITKRAALLCSTNSHGHRGREFTLRKAPGTYRIVIAGDSIVFGIAVDDDRTFCARLEQILRAEQHAKRAEVINIGVPSYNSAEVRLAVREFALKYDPDAIFVLVGANDTAEYPGHGDPRSFRLHLAEREYAQMVGTYKRELMELVKMVRSADRGIYLAFIAPPHSSFFPFPDIERVCDALEEVAVEQRVPLVDIVSMLVREERRRGVVLEQDADLQRVVRYADGRPTVLFEATHRREGSDQWIADEVYDYLDKHDADQVCFLDGGHLTEEGNELVAQRLADVIRRLGVLDEGAQAEAPRE